MRATILRATRAIVGAARLPRRRGALVATAACVLAWPSAAPAAPATPTVRIEGRERTLFEGPVLTDGHDVRAASDTQPRPCDGTNGGANPAPGPTATAATVDALAITGQGFDASWYAGFSDYFVQQLGPDREDPAAFAYWGLLVGGALTPVGGCQQRIADGDEVLWVYDAFNGRPFLRLVVAGAAAVAPGEPLAVVATQASGGPQDAVPAAGIAVAPVSTASDGVQTADPADPAAVTTDPAGHAELRWPTPGWRRVKAVAGGFVRSNRLDVCVQPCGAPPPDTLVRTPPPTRPDPTPTPSPTPAPGGGAAPEPPPAGLPAAVRLERQQIVRDGAAQGRIGVRWAILDPGAGVRRWSIESRATGSAGAWVGRAAGTTETTAQLRLPAGHVAALRFTVEDVLGRTTTVGLGDVLVPRDDRGAGRYRGRWRKRVDGAAWLQTVTRGPAGARLRVRLPAGRPAFVLRAGRRARVVLRTDGGREPLLVRAGSGERVLLGRSRARAGVVELRVRAGRVDVDGVAVR
jgi:hypothetical protein